MQLSDWTQIHSHILHLEQAGLVTRTFRRLDPDRQQAVLSAILDEAVEKGPTDLNIKQVAARAGVSVGSLYQYFGSRDNLLAFTVDLCAHFIADAFESYRPILAAMPLEEALVAYLTGGIEWSQAQVGLVQFFLRAAYGGDPELADKLVKPLGDILHAMMVDILRAAAERGELRPDLDIDTAARLVNGLMIVVGDSMLLPYLNHYTCIYPADVPPEAIIAPLIDLIMHGIGKVD